MDKPAELEFNHLLGAGVAVMLLLALVLVLFVVLHQKRVHALQTAQQQRELEHQTRLLKSVVASQESERERIAQDLHDEIGASLSTARLFINQLKLEAPTPPVQELAVQASQIVGDTLQNVRHIVQHMSPAVLEKFGFCRAVAQLGRRLEANGLQVELLVDEAVEGLGAEVQLALYRIVQELFANVVKHAEARHLVLHVRQDAAGWHLLVADDGRGFVLPATAEAAQTGGMGLSGIAARTKLLGGQFIVRAAPEQGTRVTLRLPSSLHL